MFDCQICGQQAPYFIDGIPVCFDCYFDMQENQTSGIAERVANFVGTHTIEDIAQKVCTEYDITFEKLTERTRKREITELRQVAMYLSKKNKVGTNAFIAEYFGNFDHAAVNYSENTVLSLLQTDSTFRNKFEKILL